jgi:hypothetical protein
MNSLALALSFTTLCLTLSPLLAAHTFTDRTGRTIIADIVAKQGEQIRIKRADGQEFSLAIAALSPADQAFVKSWQPAATTAPGKGAPSTPSSTPAADARAKPVTVVALGVPQAPEGQERQPGHLQREHS